MNLKTHYSNSIKNEAKRLGFLSCGMSKAGFLEEEAPRLESWLKNNSHGKMQYMENHFDKRLDPTLLVEDSKSVISLIISPKTHSTIQKLQKSVSMPMAEIITLLSKTNSNTF
jgi:epoxyqueuosine reductase